MPRSRGLSSRIGRSRQPLSTARVEAIRRRGRDNPRRLIASPLAVESGCLLLPILELSPRERGIARLHHHRAPVHERYAAQVLLAAPELEAGRVVIDRYDGRSRSLAEGIEPWPRAVSYTHLTLPTI